ncbi:MAG TPA: sensor histidine kinase, partial [Solirubrobacteraceae bacterium]|nr:sensor histidine kinase [Solirubrobacteraceae bacterium]
LLYAGDEEFLDATVGAIEHALEALQPVLVAVAQDKAALLRAALGPRAEWVTFADAVALGRNPARIIPAWARFLRDSAPGGEPALGIGEPVWPGRTGAELTECDRHEWLLNLVFAHVQPWRLLCTYDGERLDEEVLVSARRSHPLHLCGGGWEANDAYRDPDWAALVFGGRLAPPRGGVTELPFSLEHLGDVRGMVRRAATGAQLTPERSEQLVLAASELAANSVQYGGGGGSARVWRQDGALLCEVSDHGRMHSALAGRVQPRPDQLRGRGLWLVNQLCDLVQIRSGERGTAVRVSMDAV